MDIGARLREERQRLRMTQAELASVGGVQKQSQLLYEKGERKPDASYLAAVAKMGLDVLYMITGQHNANMLSEAESTLLNGFRKLDARGQSGLIGLVAGMTGDKTST